MTFRRRCATAPPLLTKAPPFGLHPGADLVHVGALVLFAVLVWRLAVWRTAVRLID